ncbi:MAG: proline dehydrogenase family protein [Nitrospirota bacterium]
MELRQRLLYPLAKKFFAGFKLEDAIHRAKLVNSRGMGAIIDFLGEDVSTHEAAGRATAEYARILEAAGRAKLDAALAVKLTNLGMGFSYWLARDNGLGLAKTAKDAGVFLWVDMEGSSYTSDTIRIYREMHAVNPECGIALQACLKRTRDDLESLIRDGAVIRLVKGAYKEPQKTAFQKSSEVRSNWLVLVQELFNNSGRFAVGTHDRRLLGQALKLSEGYGGSLEFQMLMGVRDSLKEELLRKGRRVVEYIPYGTDWYGYGIRRLMEKKRNVLYFAQGLIGR